MDDKYFISYMLQIYNKSFNGEGYTISFIFYIVFLFLFAY